MNHQSFENWLLSDGPLPSEQAQALREHLRECEACRLLKEGWSGTRQLFKTTPLAAPQPGFTARWQERLAEQRRRAYRRQSLSVLGFTAGVALTLLVVLGVQAFYVLRSPGQLLLIWLYRLTSLVAYADAAGDFLTSFLSPLLSFVPAAAWVFIFGGISMASVLWIVVYQQLISSRRIKV